MIANHKSKAQNKDEPQKLNKEQRTAVEHTGSPLLIIAGAGTGKTTVIAQKIAYLINNKIVKPENILAITFTEKASYEMEERVDQLLPYGYLDLQISTFHSFAQSILEKHGLEIGLPHDFKILDGTAAWMLIRQNLKKFKLDYYRPLGNPTKFIHVLLKHFSKCKDELISPQEYLNYAEQVHIDQDIVEFATTKDENFDMSIKSSSRSSPPTTSSMPTTSSLRKQGSSAKETKDFSLREYDEEKNLDDNKNNNNEPARAQEIKRIKEVAEAYHTYNQLLLDNGAIDLGDLIAYLIKLFRERPNLLELYKKRFTHILVDEFQDTNWSQYELVKMFAGEGSDLTVVGDDDQSIFRFRGASVSNILQFKEDFPKAKEIVLVKNYRSPQNILDLSYEVVQNNNPDRLEAKMKGLKKQLESQIKNNGDIEFLTPESKEDEARDITSKIKKLKKKEGCSWNDFAVLVRANNQAEVFVNHFRQNGIPVQFIASSGLYKQQIVLDVMAFLRVIDSYHESKSLYKILQYPMFNMPQHDAQEMLYLAKRKSWSLWFIMEKGILKDMSEEGQKLATKIVAAIKKYTESAKTNKPSQVIYKFFEGSGYLSWLAQQESKGDQYWVEQIAHLNDFLEHVVSFENDALEPTTKAFLEHHNYLLESGDEGGLPSVNIVHQDAVNILTTHRAKGLEFDHVFVTNLVEQRFPTRAHSDPIKIPDSLVKEILPEGDPHMQEERRLFYVAVTRAKKSLTLSAANNYGGKRARKISRFVAEVGFKITKNEDVKKNSVDLLKKNHATKEPTKDQYEWKLPSIFSFSQFKTFSVCPLQYKYSHILKLPVPGKPQFTFGRVVHNTLEKFYKQIKVLNSAQQGDLFGFSEVPLVIQEEKGVKVPSLTNLLEIYTNSWQDEWYRDEEEKKNYLENGKRILREFYKKHSDEGWIVPLGLEQGFKVKIGDYIFSGRVDRIDKCEDGIEIIDYKTGRPKQKLDKEDKEQLFIYQIAARSVPEFSAHGAPKKLTFYYLEDNSTQSFLGTGEELEEFEEKIQEYIGRLQQSDFSATPSKMMCKYCDFNDICPFREL